jgi:carbon monoxide dehydrogenase subunit G
LARVSAVTASIDIEAPPREVWDVVMDPERLGEWVTIHRRVARVSDSPLKEKSTLEQTLCIHHVNFKVRWQVTDVDEGALAVWEGKGPARSKAHTSYRLAANGKGGTRFDYENEFRAPLGPLGAAASRALVGGVPQREATKTLQNLKKLLEK